MTPDGPARTNFLVVLTDQQHARHVGYVGDNVLRTPAIDALAARGARFDEAYVACPICMPNRASLLTGRMPSGHGTRMNGVSLDWDVSTFPRTLRRHGYATAAVGKMHLQTMGWDPAEIEPFLDHSKRGDSVTRPREPGWDEYEFLERHRAGRVEFPEEFYGFETVDLVVGHSDYATGHYYQWALERGVDLDAIRGRERSRDVYDDWTEVYRSNVPEELYPTSYVTERTIARLREMAARKRPFMLLCSYPDPHHPFAPPGRFWDMYSPEEMLLPATFHDPMTNAPPHLQAIIARRGVAHEDPTMTWAPTEDQYRRGLAAEYGMLAMIDEGVDRILAELDALGLTDSTVVVFTSDHGDMGGDHGLLMKHLVHYRAMTAVPLVIAGTGIGGSRVSGLAQTTDLAPTILDLAGLPHYNGIHGRSLVPMLTDPTRTVRDHLLVEEDQVFGVDGLPAPARLRTLVTPEARLTRYHRQPFGELFNTRQDPLELENLFAEPSARQLRAELMEMLVEALVEADETGLTPTYSA